MARRGDQGVVLWLVAGVLAAIVLFAVFGPKEDDNDPTPSTYNTGSRGVKAAYLALGELGYKVARWEEPLDGLAGVDAAGTTLVLLEPRLPVKSLKRTQAAVAAFLQRGGRVVATGAAGAELLPGGSAAASDAVYTSLCVTTPEGPGALAEAGKVKLGVPVRWATKGPEYRVEQRCGQNAVVVSYRFGKGEAIWWSSPRPLTNLGLEDEAGLRLVLGSLGPAAAASGGAARRVLFDDYLLEVRETLGDLLGGLPWWSLGLQLGLAGLLLVVSRGRRSGPVRMPVVVPRTSPLEFAESMGRLYGRAGATEAAIGAARERLVGLLREQVGVPREAIPAGVCEALHERLGGDWDGIERHLGETAVTGKGAMEIVRRLDGDCERIRRYGKGQGRAVKNSAGS